MVQYFCQVIFICVIMVIDFDCFKMVNEIYGLKIGDFVIVEMVRCFIELLGVDQIVVWIGVDEFVVIVINREDCWQIENIVCEMFDVILVLIYILDDSCIIMFVSIGIMLVLVDGLDEEGLLI